MKIIECKKMENCFDGDFVFKYYFDTYWTKEYIKMMKAFGELRYYESFPKPMFQINCTDGTVIKGLQTEKECRIIFSRINPVSAQKSFETKFYEIMF